MTVEFFGIPGLGPLGAGRKVERPGAAEQNAKAGEAKFSSTLAGLGQAQEAREAQSSERAAKIEALRQQIANGTYEPDLEKVASSLLKFLVEG